MQDELALKQRDDHVHLSESVYETLLEAIVSGRLKAGTTVSELALATQLEVSRTPVHLAVCELVKDGLVIREANRRPTIAAFSRRDIEEVFEMRMLLEGQAAFRAATRIGRVELKRLRAQLRDLEAALGEPDFTDRWADHDEAFHREIAQASGNARLAKDIARHRLLHRGFNKLHTTSTDLERAIVEHLAILDALDVRHADEAKQAMIDHIQEWQVFFVRLFDDTAD